MYSVIPAVEVNDDKQHVQKAAINPPPYMVFPLSSFGVVLSIFTLLFTGFLCMTITSH